MHCKLVLENAELINKLITPVFTSLNTLEINFLIGLANGKTHGEIAVELSRSEKYLEQVMLKIRRKVSGVSQDEKPTINRNQLMYYAGLFNFVENADSLQSKRLSEKNTHQSK